MFQEPWSCIEDYPFQLKLALELELKKELIPVHALYEISFEVLAKREDQDDILISTESGFYIVHLTWSGRAEAMPFPCFQYHRDLESLNKQLSIDMELYS
ncbi:hypothetical protein EOPP23_21300 [Endozoicomonas sp. OPT23]|uniref:hypothetical protein n=1 Tax=Endozoicomonas sp. OPT23 TaxID=2072845 RepID=UPI00129B669D|nr:hypothetical protein [Endozoicomonas sp. OPT23]MRI35499.1 hypothetical protein [Endozoicomonas sp. OPT23]